MGSDFTFVSCIADAVRWFKQHWMIHLSLGLGTLLALGSLFCGLGFVAAPWFSCELIRVQVSSARDSYLGRSAAWLGAGLFMFVAIVMLALTATLCWMALSQANIETGLLEDSLDWRTSLIGVLAVAMTLAYLLPFIFAPHLLIEWGWEREHSFTDAILQSTRLVSRIGWTRALRWSIAAHWLQGLPAFLAAVAAIVGLARTPLVIAVTMAVAASVVLVPIGQGVITSMYKRASTQVTEWPTTRHTLHIGWVRLLWLAVFAAPLCALFAAMLVCLKPSPMSSGSMPESAQIVLDEDVSPGSSSHWWIPDTPLEIRIKKSGVLIEAGDGGGTGFVAPQKSGPIARVRAGRAGGRLAVEITNPHGAFITWTDSSGVRLDDTMRVRFLSRVPIWTSALLLFALFLTAMLGGRALTRYADSLTPSRTGSSGVPSPQATVLIALALLTCGAGAVASTVRALFLP